MRYLTGALIEHIPRTPTVMSFRFQLVEKMTFEPGQFCRVMFDMAYPDNRDMNKYLSYSCSPENEYIEVTKRITGSDFSMRLINLQPGEEVKFSQPIGTCVFKKEYQKISFLIGGIGITPVISILEYIRDKRLAAQARLFYSNRTENEIAFKKEIDVWSGLNNNLKVVYTVTDGAPELAKNCLPGRITKEVLAPHLEFMQKSVAFIFGPPAMVEAMKALCQEAGCEPANIKIEVFAGY